MEKGKIEVQEYKMRLLEEPHLMNE